MKYSYNVSQKVIISEGFYHAPYKQATFPCTGTTDLLTKLGLLGMLGICLFTATSGQMQ